MNIIITGSTGTAGSELLVQALNDPAITGVTTIARKPPAIHHPKLTHIVHQDFLNYAGLEDVFRKADACFWCLGISQSQVSRAYYFMITHDFAVAAAKAMLGANPKLTFVFLSGQGADRTGKSMIRFAKVKGITENSLAALLPEGQLYVFRPGGILPVRPAGRLSGHKRFEIAGIRLLNIIFPSTVIRADALALAMLLVLKKRPARAWFSHREIKSLPIFLR